MPSFNFGQYPSLASRFFNNYNFNDPYGYQSNSPMAGRPNPLAATFNQPLPEPPPPRVAPQSGYLDSQPQDQVPDFLSKIQDLYGKTPQRLAYEQAVNEGPPVINRSKWTRLGTALTSGAAALGGANVSDAAKLGTEAYWAPQERATRDYQAKVTRLGQAAGFEQSDIQDRAKILEAQQKDWYDRRQDYREQIASIDRTHLTAAQIKEAETNIEEKLTRTWTDSQGVKWEQGPNDKNPIRIAQVELSPTEKVAQKRAESAAEAEGRLPSEESLAKTQGGIRLAEIGAQGDERQKQIKLQNENRAKIARDKIDADLAKGGATEEYKRMAVNLKRALWNDPSLANYLKPGPDGNLIPIDESDYVFSSMSDEDKAGVGRLKAAVLAAPPKTTTTGTTTTETSVTPATTETPSVQPTGQPTTIDEVNRLPKTPDGRIVMIAPTGEKLPVPPDQVLHYIGLGATVESAPAVNKEATSTGTPSVEAPAAPPNVTTPKPGVTIRGMRGVPMGTANIPNIPLPSIPDKIYGPYGQVIARPNNPFRFNPPPSQPAGNPAGEYQTSPPNFGQNIQPPTTVPIRTPSPTNNIPISPTVPPGLFGQGMQLPPPSSGQPNIPPPVNTTNVPPPPGSVPPVLSGLGAPAPRMGPPEVPPVAPPINVPPPNIGPTPTAKPPNIPPEVEFNSMLGNVSKRFQDVTGLSIKPISTKRTAEQQAKLYAQGRTSGQKGAIVTQADGTKVLSKHQTGEAADIEFVDSKGNVVKPSKQLWETFGKIAKDEGLIWGGDWKSPYDPGHVQLGAILTRQ